STRGARAARCSSGAGCGGSCRRARSRGRRPPVGAPGARGALPPALLPAVPPFAGVVGMSPARALVPAAVASAIWYAFLVGAGTALGLSWDSARHLIDHVNRVLGVAAVAATLAVVWWVWRRARARS